MCRARVLGSRVSCVIFLLFSEIPFSTFALSATLYLALMSRHGGVFLFYISLFMPSVYISGFCPHAFWGELASGYVYPSLRLFPRASRSLLERVLLDVSFSFSLFLGD